MAALQYLYACGILFPLSCFLMAGVSYCLPVEEAGKDETLGLVWRPALWRKETEKLAAMPWYKNYRILSFLLSLLTLGTVIWWW